MNDYKRKGGTAKIQEKIKNNYWKLLQNIVNQVTEMFQINKESEVIYTNTSKSTN